MSYRTIWNPARFLSRSTRERIRLEGVSCDNYVINILSKLRARGETDLVNTIIIELAEVDETVSQ